MEAGGSSPFLPTQLNIDNSIDEDEYSETQRSERQHHRLKALLRQGPTKTTSESTRERKRCHPELAKDP